MHATVAGAACGTAGTAASAAPQVRQNRASSAFGAPHCGQSLDIDTASGVVRCILLAKRVPGQA
jgi:hypothetical protein